MPHDLSFSSLFQYDAGLSGIEVTIALQLGNEYINFPAKIDTGSSHCIFKRIHGETLGLDVANGNELIINTATGQFSAFGHFVTLLVGDFDFRCNGIFCQRLRFQSQCLRAEWISQSCANGAD